MIQMLARWSCISNKHLEARDNDDEIIIIRERRPLQDTKMHVFDHSILPHTEPMSQQSIQLAEKTSGDNNCAIIKVNWR